MTDSQAGSRLTAILASYGRFHRDPRNRLTHYFGVPAIIFSVLIPLTLQAVMVSGAVLPLDRIVVAIAAVGYISLDAGLGCAVAVALALLAAAAVSARGAQPWHHFALL